MLSGSIDHLRRYAVKTLESKETRAQRKKTVTHNSVFAAHRLMPSRDCGTAFSFFDRVGTVTPSRACDRLLATANSCPCLRIFRRGAERNICARVLPDYSPPHLSALACQVVARAADVPRTSGPPLKLRRDSLRSLVRTRAKTGGKGITLPASASNNVSLLLDVASTPFRLWRQGDSNP